MLDSNGTTISTLPLYSDVVVSRPPSPQREPLMASNVQATGDIDDERVPIDNTPVLEIRVPNITGISSEEYHVPGIENDVAHESEHGHWTTVKH